MLDTSVLVVMRRSRDDVLPGQSNRQQSPVGPINMRCSGGYRKCLWGELKKSEEVEKHTKRRNWGFLPRKKFLVGGAAASQAPPPVSVLGRNMTHMRPVADPAYESVSLHAVRGS